MAPSALASAWTLDPLVLAAAAVAAVLFARGFIRLRRRGRRDHAGWSRALLFAAGLALMTLPLVSPLDAAADDFLLSAHMLEHVLIGDAGPALVLLAIRGPLLAFVVPAAAIRFTGRHAAFGRLNRPAVAVSVWVVGLAAWHVPAAYDAALRHPWLHVLEHATFVGAGFLLWSLLIDPARRGRLSTGGRAALAGVIFMLGQALAGVLLLSPVALYPFYADKTVRLFGIAPLADQQYAALLMMAEQFLTLGAFLLLLGASVLRIAERPRLMVPA
ncbi:MAG TPA: cytochrome c oxidase assembly protein [Gaiellaceae bacterium]|jgi:cytochrome c oxidase assembly factor CtaG|nr:cytochrome c oxidase assembly protein [Gaiellaceae bacterium]